MLAVYTFVFSQVFKARWGTLQDAGPLGFAINLFAGLIVFNLFAECMNRAPNLVLDNPNYVKKVIFPLEVLGAVTVGSACFHALTSVVVLMLFQLVVLHALPLTYLWLPLVWLPLVIGSLALTWLLAAAGVFLRDIGQLVGVVVSMLLFLSPVFFPLSGLSPHLQHLIGLNPMAQVIEQTRLVVVSGHAPSSSYLLGGCAATLIACEISFRTFQKAKRAFADVM
jgi:lipopolysaccharide transport system permease protein